MASILKVNTIQDATNSNTAMTIDSSGRVITPARPEFRAYNNSAGAWTTVTHAQHQIVAYNAEKYDIGSNYDTSTYRFTCPLDGVYFFSARVYMHADGGNQRLTIATGTTNPATAEGTFLAQAYKSDNVSARSGTLYVQASAELTATTQVGVYIWHGSDTNNSYYSENNTLYSHFEGHLIG
jgi:hypothetical protein